MTDREYRTRTDVLERAAVVERFPRALRERERRVRDAAAAVERGIAVFREGVSSSELPSSASAWSDRARPRLASTQAELRAWLGRGSKALPRLWPGLGFESDSTGRPRVVIARRRLAIVWDTPEVATGLDRLHVWLSALRDSVSDRLRPIGLRAQLAVLSGIPRNAYVHGLPVDGEIVDAWD